MSVIYMLISISIVVAVFFLYAFIKAVRGGQYDDDYTPSVRMLFDDELIREKSNSKSVTLSAVEGTNPKAVLLSAVKGTLSKEKRIKTNIKLK